MTEFLQYLFAGCALGAVYALIALGFVVIYRSSQVFNFAQGEFVMVGAFLMVTLSSAGLPWPVALIAAMVITGLLGVAVERAILRPMLGRPVFVSIILTIIVGMILRTLTIVIWGANPRGMPTPWDTMSTVTINGAAILYNSLGAIVAGVIALTAYFLMLKYTRLGLAMRASASDQETALSLGIPVGRVLAITWFIAGAFAALAGTFLAMFPSSVDANLGLIALAAFPALIVGGLDSAPGTVVAGLLLGILEVFTQAYVNPVLGTFGQNFHTVFPYIVMILFLVVRPYGMFGTREVQRV